MTDSKRPTAREIVEAVVQAMHEAHEPLDENVVLVPTIYDVMIHPSAYRQLEPILGRIHTQATQRLERELERLNRSSGWVAGRFLRPLLRLFFPDHRLRRLVPGGQTVERAGEEWIVDVLVTADPAARMDFLAVEADFGGRVSPVRRGGTGFDVRRRTTRLPGGGYETILVTPRDSMPVRGAEGAKIPDKRGGDTPSGAGGDTRSGRGGDIPSGRDGDIPSGRDGDTPSGRGGDTRSGTGGDARRSTEGDRRGAARSGTESDFSGSARNGIEPDRREPAGSQRVSASETVRGSAHASVVAAAEALARGAARLDFEDREGRHTVYMEKPRIVIGRSEDADVVLSTSSDVSREHVVIRREHGTFEIQNLGRYGTRLNARPLEPTGHWHPLPEKADIILADSISIYFEALP